MYVKGMGEGATLLRASLATQRGWTWVRERPRGRGVGEGGTKGEGCS